MKAESVWQSSRLSFCVAALACLLMVWALPVYELNRSHAYALNSSKARTELAAKALSQHVEFVRSHVDAALLEMRELWTGNPAVFDEQVRRHSTFIRNFAFQVSVADGNGRLLYSSLSRNVGSVNVADRSYFKALANAGRTDPLFISEPIVGRISGVTTLQFSRPLAGSRPFAGTISVSVQPGMLTSELQRRYGYENMLAEVWRTDGTLLSRMPELPQQPPLLDMNSAWANPGATPHVSPVEKTLFLCSRSDDAAGRFILLVCESEAYVLRDHDALRNRLLVVCLLISLALLTGVFLFLKFRHDRNRSVAQLQMNRRIIDSVQQVARLGDYIWEPERQALMASENLNDILGFGNQTVLQGPQFFRLILEDDRDMVRDAIQRCSTIGEKLDVTFRWSATIFRPQLWIRMHGQRFVQAGVDGGQQVRVVGIIKDISDVKAREQSLLLAKASAEAANQAKFEFLATMSHELRTPIFGISAGMEIALRSTQLDDRTRRSLSASLRSARHLNQLVDDVLDFAKLDSRAMTLDKQPFLVCDALFAVVELFAERAEEKQLALTLMCDEPDCLFVLGDERRFRQIFFNLVGNAIKFTKTGTITLAAGIEKRGDDRHDWCVRVRDTGIGIPAEQVPRLFSPFEQGSVQTGVKYGGTGLGLSIARQLTLLMDGNISVTSQEGQGSEFVVRVSLPLASAHAPTEAVVLH